MQGAGPGAEPLTAPTTTTTPARGISGQHPADAPSPPTRARNTPPRLTLNGLGATHPTQPQPPPPPPPAAAHPCLVVEPASPAAAAASAAIIASPAASTTPYPPPIPSTSTATATTGHPQPPPPYAGSFLPPPSPQAQGGGLAARRAAKLGKKRLSLLVPANPHSSVPVAGPDPSASATNQVSLLSPLTPSFLLPASLKTPANGTAPAAVVANSSSAAAAVDDAAAAAAETRSLPPSPLSLTTFIGPEGSEAPDRTIGRLMLKQQADEMREQMRGKRGMKRRTSIPRLNLVKTGVAQAQPANLDAIASQISGSASSSIANSASASGRSAASSSSAVQFLRSAENGRGRSSSLGDGTSDGPVEEFPYALGPREILPGIFLGSEQNAKDAAVLRDWRIRFVLNVAKEVECPWLDEAQVLAAQDAVDRLDLGGMSTPAAAPAIGAEDSMMPPRNRTPTARRPTPPPPPRRAQSHTPDAPPIMAEYPEPIGPLPSLTGSSSVTASPPLASSSSSPNPVRPTFIRPTASTPNLHASFDPASSPPPPPPPVPPLPDMRDLSAVYPGLSESPPQAEPLVMPSSAASSSKRDRASARSSRLSGTTTQSPTRPCAASSSTDTIRIPSNPGSGRPALDYLWLKWGHDESDLVEAKKFQAAFDFLDQVRERDERVLVHCQCGVSRSATVVIAYCMREAARALEEGREAAELAGCTGMHDTYSFVKEKSEWVGPNLSLVFQLVAYERTLRGDSINGDDDLSEPPSAAFRSEPASLRTQSDLPPASPLNVERPFAFPPPPPSARPLSRMVNGTLASPHTPISDASLAYSQMSTPELRDPLLSPALSSATKSSSVTSTPLSPERQYNNNHLRPTVRIVQSDGDETDQSSGGQFETVLVGENARKARHDRVDSVFVLPVPPHGVQDYSSPTDLVSPTVAKYPPASIPASDRRAFPPSAPASDELSATSSYRAGLPVLAPVATTPFSTSAPALPALQVTTDHLPSPFSPASTASTTTLSPLSGSTTSPSRTPSSSPSSHDGLLARSHSGRRFGAGQSRSERRASHRRVCSDTIRVPTSLGFTSAATTPNLSSPSPAGTTPRAGTPEVDVGPTGPR